jgi:uncharacterized membrane protein
MVDSPTLAILGMAAVCYACRIGGFWAMRYVPLSPGVRAWLAGIPMAVMGAVLAPALARGGPAEWAGLAVTFVAMKATGNDILAVLAAVATVGLVRALA